LVTDLSSAVIFLIDIFLVALAACLVTNVIPVVAMVFWLF
jgi:hypothetical protein